MSPNPFDQACRFLAKLDPVPFLAWLLALTAGTFAFRGWLDTRLLRRQGETDRTCDTIAYLDDLHAGGVPWALPIEFQIGPDPTMFGRLLMEMASIWLDLRPSLERGARFCVGAVVMNLTGNGNASRAMNWPGARISTQIQIREWNLAKESADHWLEEMTQGRTGRIVLPFIPLMQRGDEEGIIQRWKDLALAEPDPTRRGEYGALAMVFAEAADRQDVWAQALQGWNMIESKQVKIWQTQARNDGKAEGKIEAILSLLEDRFTAVPRDLETRIRLINDLNLLNRLILRSSRSATLEEFQAELPN